MSIFEKERWEVWNISQHPYKHSLSEFSYVNDALPGVSNVESALNYILAVLYPNAKEEVATSGDLPAAGNSNGDYRIVTDDGDGKSAGYRWEQREGDLVASWYKIFDVDWSTEAILASLSDVTDIKYVFSQGKQDLDSSGTPITGKFAGQSIFGSNTAGGNLTLNANSGDGTGAQSGFVQVDSQFRPAQDAVYDISSATDRWRDGYFSGTIGIGTMAISSGVITDISGAISFASAALTAGNIFVADIAATSLEVSNGTNTATLVPGSYTDTSGSVTFGATDLITSGTLSAGVATFTNASHSVIVNPDNGSGRSLITSSQGAIDFVDEDLYTTGALNVGSLATDSLAVDNIILDGNSIVVTDPGGSLILAGNALGAVDIQSNLTTLGVTTMGIHSVMGEMLVDNVSINGNTIMSSNTNGDLNLGTNGTGLINFGAPLAPTISGAFDIGSSTGLLNDVYISGGIRNATEEISIGALLALRTNLFRDVAGTQPAQSGDTIFFDATNNVWLASVPDSEIDHTVITGVTTGDAGHTQFTMLAGRAGGQSIQGGTAVSENLTLESTSAATKGSIFVKDPLSPFTEATYAANVWTGTDLGAPTNRFRDVYTVGEFKGFRFENTTTATIPASSMQNRGRIVFNTDSNKALVDTGTTFNTLGVSKFVQDHALNGIDLVRDVDVSSSIEDARRAHFQLLNNANNFEKMNVSLQALNATTVRIQTSIPLPVGTYRLIVIE